MSLQLSDLYRASTTEKVLDLETDLKKELEELRQEIDESDIVTDSPSKALRLTQCSCFFILWSAISGWLEQKLTNQLKLINFLEYKDW